MSEASEWSAGMQARLKTRMRMFDVLDEAIDLEEGRMNQSATLVFRHHQGKLVLA
jgi:hypothetical protein